MDMSGGADVTATILKLFQPARPSIVERPMVQQRLREFSQKCAKTLRQATSLDGELEIVSVSLEVGAISRLLSVDAVVATSFLPPDTQVFVAMTPLLLLRSLDALYGGDPDQRHAAPLRALSELEKSQGCRMASAVSRCLQGTIVTGHLHVPTDAKLPEKTELLGLEQTMGEHVVVCLKLGKWGDRIHVLLPTDPLERLHEPAASMQAETAVPSDPSWSLQIRKHAAATQVELSVQLSGPDMTLGEIAGLRPGSIVELGEKAMHAATIASSDLSLFVGRVGQTNGCFSFLVDTPWPSARAQEV